MQIRKQINSIQALRGIAAILVMFYHKKDAFIISGKNYGEIFFGAGAMGVDLFFILSGFIMMMISRKDKLHSFDYQASGRFLINRFTRIFPLYILVTLLFYISVWRGFNFLHDKESIVHLYKSLLFIPLDGKASAPFYGYAAITVGWTLNYEMFFYLLFAISMLFGKYRWQIFFFIISVLLIFIPLIFKGHISFDAMHHYHFSNAYINMMTNPIIWDFVLGILIGFLVFEWKMIRINKRWSIALSIISFSYCGFIYISQWNALHGVTRWALPIAIFLFLIIYRELNYGLKVPRMLTFLGKISFSIYLSHLMMQYWTRSLFIKLHISVFLTTPLYLISACVITILVSILLQYLIENKLSNWFKDRLTNIIFRRSKS